MTRFGFRYDWRTAPIAFGLGLVPPLTYVNVNDDRIQVRLGPWFVLEAARAAVAGADVARGDLTPAPQIQADLGPARSRLQIRTAKGTLARIRFTEPQTGRLPFGPPRLRPRFAPIVIGHDVAVDELALSVADAAKLVAMLQEQ
jgi:hypothetical protein